MASSHAVEDLFSGRDRYRWGWWDTGLMGTVLVLLILFFGPSLPSDKTLYGSDTFSQASVFGRYGMAYFWDHGHLPKWNPYIFAGMPFRASFSLTISPYDYFAFLLDAFGIEQPYATYLIVHLFLAGLFTYLLLKHLGLSWYSCYLGAILFSFDNYLISRIFPGHGGKVCVTAFLPLGMFFLWKGLKHLHWPSFLWFGAVIGLQYLSRHPQILFYCILGYGLLFVWEAWWRYGTLGRWDAVGKAGAWFAAGMSVGVMLAAVEFWPNYEFKKYTFRDQSRRESAEQQWSFSTSWSLPPEEVLGLVIRNPFGWGSERNESEILGKQATFYRGRMGLRQALEYLGIMPVVLAILGLIGLGLDRAGGRLPAPKVKAAASDRASPAKKKKGAKAVKHESSAAPKAAPSALRRLLDAPGSWLSGLWEARKDENGRFLLYLTVLGLFALALVLGKYSFVYTLAYTFVPAFRMFRVPLETFCLVAFAASLIPAFGLEFAVRGGRFERRRLLYGMAAATGVLAVLGLLVFTVMKGDAQGMGSRFAANQTVAEMMSVRLGGDQLRVVQYVAEGRQVPGLDAKSLQSIQEYIGEVQKRFRHFCSQAILAAGLLLGAAVLLALLAFAPNPAVLLVAVLCVFGFSLGDVWTLDDDFIIAMPKKDFEDYYKPVRAVPFLMKDHSQFRIFSHRVERYPNEYMANGIQSITGYHAAPLEYTWRTLQNLVYPAILGGQYPQSRILDLLNVKYLVLAKSQETFALLNTTGPDGRARYRIVYDRDGEDGGWLILENQAVLPRAYIVRDFKVVQGEQSQLSVLSGGSFNPDTSALVEEEVSFPSGGGNSSGQADRATITSFDPDVVKASVEASAPGLVVFSEVWYPGWQAAVDGNSAPLVRSNLLFRGVPVPAGKHEVILTFNPASHQLGKLLSGFAAFLVLGVSLFLGWKGLPSVPALRNPEEVQTVV